ncbi:hypothetical protein Salat_2047800 [Sesamum alatum]|uniref:Uncharacterized protein n=1 Tax=Sesamum alatum TaxID=300844 RepID=A0AAE1Y0Q2_9LAMI|nr:hypothetical protein Salat_2047800 [Sesamum alatum]
MSPFHLIFGKNRYLPVELEHKVCCATEFLNFDFQSAMQEIGSLIARDLQATPRTFQASESLITRDPRAIGRAFLLIARRALKLAPSPLCCPPSCFVDVCTPLSHYPKSGVVPCLTPHSASSVSIVAPGAPPLHCRYAAVFPSYHIDTSVHCARSSHAASITAAPHALTVAQL